MKDLQKKRVLMCDGAMEAEPPQALQTKEGGSV